MITLEDGKYLVKLARNTAESWIKDGIKMSPSEPISDAIKVKTGAFVTVKTYQPKSNNLRGCIGYPIGIDTLYQEVMDLALESTLHDPRFSPVKPEELSEIVFEVTILSIPEEINYSTPQDLISQIKVGRDGLIVEYGRNKGLLLPQVPIEQNWDEETFLTHTCRKAWLEPTIWKEKKIKVFKFTGVIFGEEKPKGEIAQKDINSC